MGLLSLESCCRFSHDALNDWMKSVTYSQQMHMQTSAFIRTRQMARHTFCILPPAAPTVQVQLL